jgi:hypothetical protein
MPIIIITGAEIHYIKAEAYFRGIGVEQDKMQGEIEYLNGINSSVSWWMDVAENSRLPSSGLTFPEKITIPGQPECSQCAVSLWFLECHF